MFSDFLETVQEQFVKRETFAIAMIVNRRKPSSSKPGDKAVIKKDGTILGWIGGGCTRNIVLKEALLAIKDGKPRLVKISPEAEDEINFDVKTYKMTCQSGGSIDVYIEPVLPKPQLLIIGKTHIAMALSKIGGAMGYRIIVSNDDPDKEAFPGADELVLNQSLNAKLITPHTFTIVCTQGENDESTLKRVVQLGVGYLAFVASDKKAAGIKESLKQMGVEKALINKIRTPAGLDINAKLPEEVAISILAEIIKDFREESQQRESFINDEESYFLNPVCQIPIEKSTARHIIPYQGVDYYFCCDGCKVAFEKEPEKYAPASGQDEDNE